MKTLKIILSFFAFAFLTFSHAESDVDYLYQNKCLKVVPLSDGLYSNVCLDASGVLKIDDVAQFGVPNGPYKVVSLEREGFRHKYAFLYKSTGNTGAYEHWESSPVRGSFMLAYKFQTNGLSDFYIHYSYTSRGRTPKIVGISGLFSCDTCSKSREVLKKCRVDVSKFSQDKIQSFIRYESLIDVLVAPRNCKVTSSL